MWTFCWCFIFLFVTSSLGSVYSVYFLRGTWCNNDHLDYSPKGFFWCLRICTCDFCMANDFLAQRHLLSQICVFSGPTGGWKTSCQMYKTILWAPSLFPTLPVQKTQEFFFWTTITSWVCCTGRVGKEGGSSQYVHIVLYIGQQIFVIRSTITITLWIWRKIFWKGSDGAEKLEHGPVLPRQNQKLLNAGNISGKFITGMWLLFVAGQQKWNAGLMLGVPS